MSNENKELVLRIPEEIFNQGNLAVAGEIFAPDYVEHAVLPPGIPAGVEGLTTFVSALRTAFPDFRYTVEDNFADGDTVVTRLTAQGTQQGDFMGIPATGKSARWSEIHISRIEDGRLVEHWVNRDDMGMLQQLGVIPSPGSSES